MEDLFEVITYPPGDMVELEVAGVRARIAPEAGGRLASLVVGGHELLVQPAGPDDRSITWGCFLMAPWPGRLAGGRFAWRGREVLLARTHGPHAIHGLAWDRAWRVEEAGATSATLACLLPAEWPMGGSVRQRFDLAADRLRMSASVTARAAMPAAIGWHPWFARRDAPVAVRVDAAAVLETRGLIPTGALVPVRGRLDLRGGPCLGRRRLDHAYVGATSPATIAWPDLRLSIRFDPSPGVVVVHSPPRGVCVEPQTAPPNALALPPAEASAAGVRFLEPGATFEATCEIVWARPAGRRARAPDRATMR